MTPDARLDALLARLGDHLAAQRAAGACRHPLAVDALEGLARERLAAREAGRARRHLATCSYCLQAYVALQGALADARAALEPPAEVHVAELAAAMLAAAPRPLRLEAQVARLRSEMGRLLKSLRVRAVQRRYSEPHLAEDVPAFARAYAAGPAQEPEPGDAAAAEILETLAQVEGQLHERLDTVSRVRGLVGQSGRLLVALERSTLPEPTWAELRAKLEESRDALVAAVLAWREEARR